MDQWLSPDEQDVIYTALVVLVELVQRHGQSHDSDLVKTLWEFRNRSWKNFTDEELVETIIDLIGKNGLDIKQNLTAES